MKIIYTEEQKNEILQRYRSGEKVVRFVKTPVSLKALFMSGQGQPIKSCQHVGLSKTTAALRNIKKDGRSIAVIPLSC